MFLLGQRCLCFDLLALKSHASPIQWQFSNIRMSHCRITPSSMCRQHLLCPNPPFGRVLRNNLELPLYRRSRKLHPALCCMTQNGAASHNNCLRCTQKLSATQHIGLCVDQAWALLKKLTKADIKGQAGKMTADSDARQLLRQAVQVWTC